jgi:membrane-bound lytic murein transglycosylase B
LFDEASELQSAAACLPAAQPKRRAAQASFFKQYTTNPTNFILQPPPDTAGMAKRPEPPKPTSWTIYKLAAKAVRLGQVEAPDEAAAIEKAAAEFKVPANRLMATRR